MTDSDRRGRHILEAVVTIVSDKGLDAVSMRAVATVAGVSLAQVQYYFRSKDELLAATFRHVSEGVERRAGEVETTGPSRAALQRLLRLWLPLDEARAREARVWVAFTAAAATSARLRSINAEINRDLRTFFTEFLSRAQQAGEIGSGVDPDGESGVLLAVVDGLVLRALTSPTQEEGDAVLAAGVDAYLARLSSTQRPHRP